MSRYTGPKARANRRLGVDVFEGSGGVCASERKSKSPGMAMRPRKLSTYGEAMREKQKIKYFYGLGERQLRRLFTKAVRTQGNTGENLLLSCERRLDCVVRVAGLAKTRQQARQGLVHGHFLLNGQEHIVASTQVKVGDVIHVKRRASLLEIYRGFRGSFDGEVAKWLTVDAAKQEIIVSQLPTAEDITLSVEVGMVVELLSR